MMVMSDGGVRFLVFNQKATVNKMQPSNKTFHFFFFNILLISRNGKKPTYTSSL